MSAGQKIVRVADLQVATTGEVLITVGLGSCVAIVLYDAVARIGGMAHVLLPSPALSRLDGNPAKFPQTAVPRLLELMSQCGASPRRLTARLVRLHRGFAGRRACVDSTKQHPDWSFH